MTLHEKCSFAFIMGKYKLQPLACIYLLFLAEKKNMRISSVSDIMWSKWNSWTLMEGVCVGYVVGNLFGIIYK